MNGLQHGAALLRCFAQHALAAPWQACLCGHVGAGRSTEISSLFQRRGRRTIQARAPSRFPEVLGRRALQKLQLRKAVAAFILPLARARRERARDTPRPPR